ncbi:MAG: hypothetical protein K1X79_06330 [Oligoflexia bacterium]|nr:hypothetical protein [Oligoflexia bacterium]
MVDPTPHRAELSLVEQLAVRALATGSIVDIDADGHAPAAPAASFSAMLGEDSGIPAIDQIRVPTDRVSGHFLERFLRAPGQLGESDLVVISHVLAASVSTQILGVGAVPASTNAATHYSSKSWLRDSAMIALALKRDGKADKAEAILWNILSFHGAQEQRWRFDHYHTSPDPVGDYAKRVRHPHAMTDIAADGRLKEATDVWGHEQLDSIGWLIFLPFRLANEGALNLGALNDRITKEVNSFNADESLFVVALKFLNRIEAWNQSGRGPWEDMLKQSRASELGMMLAGLIEAQKFFASHPNGWGAFACCYGKDVTTEECQRRLREEVDRAEKEIRAALLRRVPDVPGALAIECDDETGERRSQDSGMLWLLYPGEIGLTVNQEAAILRTVYRNMREVGFVRWPGDSYVGQDYANERREHMWPDFADGSVPNYREARWSLFDPLLAAYYARRYVTSGSRDGQLLVRADRHLRRTLAMITNTESQFDWYRQDRKGVTSVTIPRHCLPEAEWFDTQSGLWRPNHNSPLMMANAALALAMLRYGYALTHKAAA